MESKTPIRRVCLTPVTHLFSAIYRGYFTQFITGDAAHLVGFFVDAPLAERLSYAVAAQQKYGCPNCQVLNPQPIAHLLVI